MTIAYIISAYKLPEQLIRLVRALRGPDRSFYVHVDRRSPDVVYDTVAAGLGGSADVELLARHDCRWGDFGHVRATLKGLDRLAASGRPYDYAVLLTGQDYPIKSRAAAEATLAAQPGRSFMNFRPLPVEGLEDGGYARLPSRELPYGMTPYFGSGYWMLHRGAVEYVRAFLANHPAYVPYFERVRVPDEMFFQTILINSPLRGTVVNDDLRFIKWPGPMVLTAAHLDEIRQTPDLFARKFDETVDGTVLDAIDRLMR
jgi:hypothetical protein